MTIEEAKKYIQNVFDMTLPSPCESGHADLTWSGGEKSVTGHCPRCLCFLAKELGTPATPTFLGVPIIYNEFAGRPSTAAD